ncbi:MAG: hypothetical protein ACYSR0_09570 [Planctomycetota bacterium]|jgi:hypothetical protein
MDEEQMLWGLGQIINAMGGGGDRNQAFPQSDVDDLQNGARYIPGQVTLARRRGEKVAFNPAKCEWTLPDGIVIIHLIHPTEKSG